MAEINSNAGHGRHKGGPRRSKKLSTKVDLTPMVDLGFLLITFFVFTTSMSKAKTMDLIMPAGKSPTTPTGKSTALTVIPVAGNRIFYYHGELDAAMKGNLYGITNFSTVNGLRDIIKIKQSELGKNPKFTKDDLMLIIKPSPEASYDNVVNILDETLINALKHYAIVDLETADKETMLQLGIR